MGFLCVKKCVKMSPTPVKSVEEDEIVRKLFLSFSVKQFSCHPYIGNPYIGFGFFFKFEFL